MRYFFISPARDCLIAEPEVITNPVRTQCTSYQKRRKRRIQECEWILDSLGLESSAREQTAFWVKRSWCISDHGRRKYKTHNRLQRIFKDPEQLTEVYQSIRELLEDLD